MIDREKILNWLFYFAIVAFLVLPFFIPFFYQSPDDNYFCLITSGAYTGEPSPFTTFQGYYYSSFISWLYTQTDKVEWYFVVNHILLICCYCVLILKLLKSKASLAIKTSLFIFSTVIQLFVIVLPQWTILAAELGLASFILFIDGSHIKSFLLAFLLFWIGCEIRFYACVLPWALLSPFFLFLWSKGKVLFFAKTFFALLFLSAGYFWNTYTKSVYSQNEEWKTFSQYNRNRGYFQDNKGRSDIASMISDSTERTAYYLTITALQYDDNITSKEDLAQYGQWVRGNTFNSIKSNFPTYLSMYNRYGGILLILLALVLFVYFFRRKDFLPLFILTSVLLLFVFANLYLMNSSGAKLRTVISVYMSFSLSLLYLYVKNVKTVKSYTILFTSVFIILSVVFSYRFYEYYKVRLNRQESLAELESLLQQVPDQKVFGGIGTITADYIPAQRCHISPAGKKILRTGWMNMTPHTKKHYKGYVSFAEGLKVLVSKTDPGSYYLNSSQKVIRDFYHVNTEVKTLYETEHFKIVEFEKVD